MSDPRPPEQPTVSVLMTVYNGQRYLSAAVESVLEQTYHDFEFVIIDDGSTDSSPAILERYAKQDCRIRILTRSNKGLTKSLNEGLQHVRGRYLARMDADDISLPNRFEKQVTYLDEHPDRVLVGTRCILIDPDGLPICEKRHIVMEHEEIDTLLLRMSWPLVHPSVMMRTEVVKQVGGYDERYRTNQDHDLFLRLAEVGKLANLPEILLLYRQHFESIGFRRVAEQTSTVLEIARAAHARRGLPFDSHTRVERVQLLQPRDHRRNWAWWALAAGNVSTARRHALGVFRSEPFSKGSWRLFFSALRGR